VDALWINDRVVIPVDELSWTAVRASGPGGQNVNKVSSKVELRFDIVRTRALAPGAKTRLYTLCRNKLDAEGRVRIVSQATRDQLKNLEDARAKLAALVLEALTPPKPRRPTKPTRGSKERRLKAKRHTSAKKQFRSDFGDD
jgi:ribosome-associated protein